MFTSLRRLLHEHLGHLLTEFYRASCQSSCHRSCRCKIIALIVYAVEVGIEICSCLTINFHSDSSNNHPTRIAFRSRLTDTSTWYRYQADTTGISLVSVSPILQPIPEPIPVGHDTFVTTANAVCWLFTRSRKWSYIEARYRATSLHINWIGTSDNYNPPYPTVQCNGQSRPVGCLIR